DVDGTPLDDVLKELRSQIVNQVYSSDKNKSAELKETRVSTDGEIHATSQDRLNYEFRYTQNLAKNSKELSDKHENEIQESAYYNEEVTYVSGRKFDTTYKIVHILHKDKNGNIIKLKKGISGSNPNKPEHITARQFAKNTGATFVANASTGSGSQLKLHGQQIYNGRILDSIKSDEYEPIKDRWTLAIGDDNTLEAFPQNITA